MDEIQNIENWEKFVRRVADMKYRITNDFAIRLIVKKIAESVMRPLSYSRLTNILKSAGATIGKQTVINYVNYIVDSYMLFTIKNYAAKLVEKETSPKYYFENNVEIDFYIPDSQLAIQVSYRVLDDFDTRSRETEAFVKLKKYLPEAKCVLLTNSEEAELDEEGVSITVMPVWKWLLKKDLGRS